MTPQTIEKMKRYEVLKLQIKELENELDMLKPDILAELHEDQEVATEHGKFTMQRKTTWEFSKGLQEDMAREKADGTAKEKKSAPFIKYTQNKV